MNMNMNKWRHWGRRTARITPSSGDNRIKLIFLWLNLERTLDKRRGKMGVLRRRQLKRSKNVITFQKAMT